MSKNGITIRHAKLKDKDNILNFIRDHWKSDHVFITNQELFDYYHIIDDQLTYVIAEDDNTKEIYGLQGYIASNKSSNPDVWGAIWKTINTPNPYPFLGVKIMQYIRETTNCRIFAGCGANPKTTIPLLKFLKEHTGKLNHYYRLADINNYKIAEVNKKYITDINYPNQYSLKRFFCFDELIQYFDIEKYKYRKPYKDAWYLNRRYFEHPVYRYQVYGIEKENGSIDSILVARVQEKNGAKVLRILDFIGLDTDLAGIGTWVINTLEKQEYEYIDCYCKGIPHEIMKLAGFTLKTDNDPNIIPNYFEPFVNSNIDIYYNTNIDDDFYVFKADSDQDRPNLFDN